MNTVAVGTQDQNEYLDAFFSAGHGGGHVADASGSRESAEGPLPPPGLNSSYTSLHPRNHAFQHHPTPPPMSTLPLDGNYDFLGSIVALGQSSTSAHAAPPYSPQIVLQQRLKLNQLQQLQLQSQLLQHQVRPRALHSSKIRFFYPRAD
jgi:hypothetical protein